MEDKLKRFKESLRSNSLKIQQEQILAKVLTPEQLEARDQFLKENGKPLFDKADQVISYERMPQGLKEAQERNDVRDHKIGILKWIATEGIINEYDPNNLPLYASESLTVDQAQKRHPEVDFSSLKKVKYLKGDFKLIADAVIFEESQEGVFTIGDPANLNDAAKNFLDRKFPGVQYMYGTEVIYMPKAIIEPDVFYITAVDSTPTNSPDNVAIYTKDMETGSIDVLYRGPNTSDEFKKTLKLNFGQSKKEEMTEKVEAYKETKERVIQNEEAHKAFVASTESVVKGFEPEVKEEFEKQVEAILPFYNAALVVEKIKPEEPLEVPFPSLLTEMVDYANRTKAYIGVDPGKQGGIVAIGAKGIIGKWIIPLIGDSVDAPEIWNILNKLKNSYDLTLVLEDVHSLFGMSASTNFSMGHTLGILDGIIAVSKIRLIRTPPKTWQKEIWQKDDMQYKPLKPEQKKPSVDTKLTSMKAAMRLFPGADFRKSARAKNPHDGICDACCLAEYGRRKNL